MTRANHETLNTSLRQTLMLFRHFRADGVLWSHHIADDILRHCPRRDHSASGMVKEQAVPSFNADMRKFQRDLDRAIKNAVQSSAAPIAREAMKAARAENAQQVTFRCANDGWMTTATTEAELRSRIRAHYRSSRHKA